MGPRVATIEPRVRKTIPRLRRFATAGLVAGLRFGFACGASNNSGTDGIPPGGSEGGGGGAAAQCPTGTPVPPGATVERLDGVPPLDAFNANGETRTNV